MWLSITSDTFMNTLLEPIPVSFIIDPPDHGNINLLQEVGPIILGTYDSSTSTPDTNCSSSFTTWNRSAYPSTAMLAPSTGEWVANFYTMEETVDIVALWKIRFIYACNKKFLSAGSLSNVVAAAPAPAQKRGWFSSLFTKPHQFRILMVGLDAAGRTSILYRLILNEVISAIPTIGTYPTFLLLSGKVTFVLYPLHLIGGGQICGSRAIPTDIPSRRFEKANILAWLQFPGICQAYPKYGVACHHNATIHGTLAKFPEVTSNTPNSAKTADRNFLAC
ncbi:hypothetical protein Pelo_7184 [Pelomyxa schiedti]|nr:hypothetical protein Pelo_7184 [Pelomyxa schiedti]